MSDDKTVQVTPEEAQRAQAEPVEWELYQQTAKQLNEAFVRIGQLEGIIASAGLTVPPTEK
jgi:hypothetical protein